MVKMFFKPEIKFWQKKRIRDYFDGGEDLGISHHAFKRALNCHDIRPYTAHAVFEILEIPQNERKDLIEYREDKHVSGD